MKRFVCFCLIALTGCSTQHQADHAEEPPQVADSQTVAPQVVATIENAFGSVDRDAVGRIVAVDLARARSSVDDEVLNAAISIPGLKKLRVAGSGISRETLAKIARQTQLHELFLQDTVIANNDLATILAALPDLKRLTLRRNVNVTDASAETFLAKKSLRNLALIEMNVGRKTLETLSRSQTVTALDLRDCSRLTPGDYALITDMRQLTDLKIGGFNISDPVLETVAQLPNLTGLTIEDAMISPDTFTKVTENAAWRDKLTQLVLSRNMALFDAGLLPIRNLPNLRQLTVCGMIVTGTFLEQWAEDETTRPKLETLSLRMSLLTPEGAAALKKYPELKSLDLSGVAMTDELAEILASLDTLESLNLDDNPISGK